MRSGIALLFSVGILLASPLLSAPNISAVSGTLTGTANDETANVLTITGTNFGSKSPATPYAWATFDTSTGPTTLGQYLTWQSKTNFSTTTGFQMSHSTQSLYGTWENSTDTVRSFSVGVVKSTWTEVFILARRYLTNGLTANQKIHRHLENNDGSGTDNFVASSFDSGIFLHEVESNTYYDSVSMTSNTWVTEWAHWTHGNTSCTSKVSDGIWELYYDGVKQQHANTVCNGEQNLTFLAACHAFTDAAALQPDGTQIYCDDLFIDDDLAGAFLANTTTLSSSTAIAPLITKTWSTTEVTAYVHITEDFPSDSTAYVFIRDSNGDISTGYQVTIGSVEAGVESGNIPIAVRGG